MSFKKFDKMCENMIMGKTSASKDVYDERQCNLRTKLTLEGFKLYALLSFVALIIYEAGYQYCESVVSLIAFLGAVCYLWWVLRNLHYGSFFGVTYSNTAFTAGVVLGEMLVYIIIIYNHFADEKATRDNFFVNNGQLSEEFVSSIAMLIMIVSSVVVFAALRMKKKSENSEETCGEEPETTEE